MKFDYQYRTSDNVQHSDVVEAPSREAAFQLLKARGIRPARLAPSRGLVNAVLANRRWLLAAAFAAIAAVAVWLWLGERSMLRAATAIPESMPRHQIYGDPELVSSFDRWAELVKHFGGNCGYAVLAAYARPGLRTVPGIGRDEQAQALRAVLPSPLAVGGGLREIVELRQIVNWMRRELLEYVADSEDSEAALIEYVRQLELRYEREAEIYYRTKRGLEGSRDERAWELGNASLRRLGLRTVPMPVDDLSSPDDL